METNDIELIALAGLLHDIGKFGQRAENYALREGAYTRGDYKYTHAAYTAQILNDLAFNLGDEMSDAAAKHHYPEADLAWIVAAADRMASGFEREHFEEYNALYDKEDFRKQRLWYLFDESKRFKIAPLLPENIFPEEGDALTNEYDALWESFVQDMREVREKGNSSIDAFTIDYLLEKYTSFVPSSTSFKKGGFDAVKANIPLYEHSKATAAFAATIYKLYKAKDSTIVEYYKNGAGEIERKNMLFVVGDFFGIQNFIFDSVPAAKASKILRAKSAYVQILIKVVALYLVDRLGLSLQNIISTHAGKFEILATNDPETHRKLSEIQRELDRFFIDRYFAQTGIGLSSVECSLADFIVKGRYKERLRRRIAEAVEAKKFDRFDLRNQDPLLHIDEGLNNATLCPLCEKRKIEEEKEYCPVCDAFVWVGEQLAKKRYLTLSRGSGQRKIFADFHLNFSDEPNRFDNAVAIFDISNDPQFRGYAKWALQSYVQNGKEGTIATFEELAESSVEEGRIEGRREHGVEALMALKGDVDNMGSFIRESEVTASFARYNFFARMTDYFFSVYASHLMRSSEANLYTVFAGGDDIFVLGAWDEVIDFAKELRKDFERFARGSGLSISMGMVMIKPNKPINFVASVAERALEAAKETDGKDAITLFGETAKWEDYLDDLGLRDELERIVELPTAFLYRLLEFTQMSQRVKEQGKIEDTIWKSKFAYTVRRNMRQISPQLFNTLDEMIEKYPGESRMVLSEFIYKRRSS